MSSTPPPITDFFGAHQYGFGLRLNEAFGDEKAAGVSHAFIRKVLHTFDQVGLHLSSKEQSLVVDFFLYVGVYRLSEADQMLLSQCIWGIESLTGVRSLLVMEEQQAIMDITRLVGQMSFDDEYDYTPRWLQMIQVKVKNDDCFREQLVALFKRANEVIV